MLVAMAMLIACSCSDPSAPAPNFTFALTPTERSITRSGSHTIAVSLNRNNYPAAISMSLLGLPPGVTGTFEPATISGETSSLTLAVGPEAVAGEYRLTVIGESNTSPALEQSATFDLTIVDARIALAGGWHHSIVVTAGNGYWGLGRNALGQLGDGTIANKLNPTLAGVDTEWRLVVAAEHHTLAIKSDGTLWGWGNNIHGQLGDGTTISRGSPTPIAPGVTWLTASTAEEHSLAIRSDGTLWSWGSNVYGQLGDGSKTNRLVPVRVGTGNNWSMVVAGELAHSLALRSDGTLWAWGNNGNGQHGDGTSSQKLHPVQTGSEANWKSIAGGGAHMLAIKFDGSLWAWGFNGYGQVGDGTATGPVNHSRYDPVQITDQSWQNVSAGLNHSIAIRSDGTLWTWGDNNTGQVGDGTTANIRSAPTQIGTDNNWNAIDGGVFHSLAAKSDGTVWGWGFNGFGQLGDGSTTTRLNPVQVNLQRMQE